MIRVKTIYFVHVIVALSFLDALITDMGIRHRWVTEANPFAYSLYEWNVGIFYVWKVLLPLILLGIYPYVSQIPVINRLILASASIYIAITIYHAGWLGLVL
jgi:hypothetical protein